jgi:glycine cleavage system regulatory protein
MSTSIVLTVVADDQPGIVEDLSDALATHGGNWTESSMMTLAGKFAGILLAELPEERADSFLLVLDSLEAGGMQIIAQRSDLPARPEGAREYSIELVGQDHPGIVHDITQVLAGHGVNVLELETTVQGASMSGERLFIAHARIAVPETLVLDELRDQLEDLANELMVDIELDVGPPYRTW